ncbi:MAG: hypothetical protein R3B71_01490 [Candidatus Gracilibacteria bacterium]
MSKKVGIVYSRDVYESVPDPLERLDKRFLGKTIGGLIEDLRYKIERLGTFALLVDESKLKEGFESDISVFYMFPLLSYLEGDEQVIHTLRTIDEDGLFFNSLYSLEASANKIRTFNTFKRCCIPIPETLVTYDLDEARNFIQKYGTVLSKPEIGSEAMGVIPLEWDADKGKVFCSQGRGQISVTFDDRIINKNPRFSHYVFQDSIVLRPPIFLQEYIGNDHAEPRTILKIYVLEDKVTSGLRIFKVETKTLEENIISYNDLVCGASQELLSPDDISSDVSELARMAIKAFGLNAGLVDLIWDYKKGQWVVLEVNNDDFGKVRDRSERIAPLYRDGGTFDWNQKLAEALCDVKK